MTKIPSQRSFLVVCSFLAIIGVSWGQSTSGLVEVDGATNPTAIPDGTAFSLLFLSLLPSQSESPALYQQRFGSQIEAIGLTVVQGQTLLAAAKQFEVAVIAQDSRTAQIRSIKPVPVTTRLQLRSERDGIANAIAVDLQQSSGAASAPRSAPAAAVPLARSWPHACRRSDAATR